MKAPGGPRFVMLVIFWIYLKRYINIIFNFKFKSNKDFYLQYDLHKT